MFDSLLRYSQLQYGIFKQSTTRPGEVPGVRNVFQESEG